jgi:hypothetical protein
LAMANDGFAVLFFDIAGEAGLNGKRVTARGGMSQIGNPSRPPAVRAGRTRQLQVARCRLLVMGRSGSRGGAKELKAGGWVVKLRNEPNFSAKKPMKVHKCPKKRTQNEPNFKPPARPVWPSRAGFNHKSTEIPRSLRTGSEPDGPANPNEEGKMQNVEVSRNAGGTPALREIQANQAESR